MTIPAHEALTRLREGNARFVRSDCSTQPALADRRRALVAGQRPFAVVLACSDSRSPAEMVFDQGLGDLFVIRVAGNVVAPSLLGSVEYAATALGTQLVVVMGHTHCGAVTATRDAVEGRLQIPTDGIRDVVDRIRPAVQTVLSAGRGRPDDELLREAIRANVRSSVDHVRHGSRLLEELGRADRLMVVGAEHDLATGRVDFFEVPG